MKKELPIANHSPVLQKTAELCQTILEQPAYLRMRDDIMAFLQNEGARAQYEDLCTLQENLHRKQDEGGVISDEEMEAFEQAEALFLASPQAAPFIEAQQSMHEIESKIMDYVRRTFELGRVPQESDFEGEAGGCGEGCGCHG